MTGERYSVSGFIRDYEETTLLPISLLRVRQIFRRQFCNVSNAYPSAFEGTRARKIDFCFQVLSNSYQAKSGLGGKDEGADIEYP